MENTSKALLVAAAVLVVILIITLGIRIFSSVSSTGEDSEKVGSSLSAQVFNANYAEYFQGEVSSEVVIKFLNQIIDNYNQDKSHAILVNAYNIFSSKKTHQKTPTQITTIINKIKDIDPNAKYTIYPTTGCNTYRNKGYRNDGYVGCISITKK